jgi:hypothetical protein
MFGSIKIERGMKLMNFELFSCCPSLLSPLPHFRSIFSRAIEREENIIHPVNK